MILTIAFVCSLFLLRPLILAPVSNETVKLSDVHQPSMETETMETEIFDEINTIRLRLGNSPLEWDERIYSAAKAHSVRLRIHKIFSHKDPDGDDVIDRLKGEGLFFLTAAENICGVPSDTSNIPDAAVEGWMKSPGHRWTIVDRDKTFTHGAVGVDCSESSCLVTFDCADFVVNRNMTLKPNYYSRINLNDESFGFEGSYPVSIEVTSSDLVDVYFFDSLEKLNIFTKTGSGASDDAFVGTIGFSDRREATRDSYMLIRNNYDS
ncbi:MAG: CAP domain-containing protein, partial [Deltaproteobacteria bacterium]|nr:CAP domain-containing protein [Deltaproteobacteria bacterium]